MDDKDVARIRRSVQFTPVGKAEAQYRAYLKDMITGLGAEQATQICLTEAVLWEAQYTSGVPRRPDAPHPLRMKRIAVDVIARYLRTL